MGGTSSYPAREFLRFMHSNLGTTLDEPPLFGRPNALTIVMGLFIAILVLIVVRVRVDGDSIPIRVAIHSAIRMGQNRESLTIRIRTT